MGKYMKKSKLKGQATALESAQSQFSLGVTTRAKTLALQRLQASTLRRSRRLANKPTETPPQSPREVSNPNPNSSPNSRLGVNSGSVDSGLSCSRAGEGSVRKEESVVQSLEASFGENVVGTEQGDRSTRETTPCSLIVGSDTVGTPGSTTRVGSSSATNRRMQNTMRTIPLAREMDEFFAGAEQQQQRIFTEKYNFDPVNESPLPGRYEWERVNP